ncbi:MAG TPA: redox-sensing transcriptional repressor Rex [bacterium]|jgi:redox-sensing transcriptional repressor|nr:redox-sensing transcriptional repressor Rex [bacterium]
MLKKSRIPVSTVNRLSLYLRVFSQIEASGQATVASRELAGLSGINPAQVRKDLAYFGQFGRRGVGYAVGSLKRQIRGILGLDRDWNCAIIGMGHLGQALLMYKGLRHQGFNVVAAFDSDPDKIHWELEGVPVYDIAELGSVAQEKKLEIAILAVPASVAHEVAELVARARIPAILNFAPVPLHPGSGVLLRQVDLAGELEALSYQLQKL